MLKWNFVLITHEPQKLTDAQSSKNGTKGRSTSLKQATKAPRAQKRGLFVPLDLTKEERICRKFTNKICNENQ